MLRTRPRYTRTIFKRNNQRPFWISVGGKLGQKNHQARLPAAVREMSPRSSRRLRSLLGKECRPDTRERRNLSLGNPSIIVYCNIFRPHKNVKLAFSNSSGLKSVFEKLRFRDGFSVDGRTNSRKKLRFHISPA